MLQNRAFQQVTPSEHLWLGSCDVLLAHGSSRFLDTAAALNAWASVGSATIEVIADPTPVSSALPNSMQMTIPAGAAGTVGFGNSGFFGAFALLTSHHAETPHLTHSLLFSH